MANDPHRGAAGVGPPGAVPCPRCGQPVPEGIAFCPLCSKRVRRYDVPVGVETRMWGTAALVGAAIGASGGLPCLLLLRGMTVPAAIGLWLTMVALCAALAAVSCWIDVVPRPGAPLGLLAWAGPFLPRLAITGCPSAAMLYFIATFVFGAVGAGLGELIWYAAIGRHQPPRESTSAAVQPPTPAPWIDWQGQPILQNPPAPPPPGGRADAPNPVDLAPPGEDEY